MDCTKYIELMSAVLDGECTAEERRELDAHLAVCPECAALFEILSANAKAARELDCEMPAGLKERIMNNLPEQEQPKKQGKVIRWKRWAPVAAAACLVLVVSLFPRFGMNDSTGMSMAPNAVEAAPGAKGGYAAEFDGNYGISNDPAEVNPVPSSSIAEAPDTTDPASPAGEPAPSQDPGSPSEPEYYGFENQQGIELFSYRRPELPEPGAQIISSTAEMDAYLNKLARYASDGTPISEPGLESLREQYAADARFYDTNRLLCVLVHANQGGDQFRIAPQGLRDGTVILEQTMLGPVCSRVYFLVVAEVGTNFESTDRLDTVIAPIDLHDLKHIDRVRCWNVGSTGQSDDSATVIHSMEELQTYLAQYPYSFDDVTALYSDEYFQAHSLVAIINAEAHGTLMQMPAYLSSSRVYLYRDSDPSGNDSGSTWLTLIEVADKMENCHSLELITAYARLQDIRTSPYYPN